MAIPTPTGVSAMALGYRCCFFNTSPARSTTGIRQSPIHSRPDGRSSSSTTLAWGVRQAKFSTLLVQLDQDLMGIVAALLAEAGAAGRWKEAGVTIAELSEQLLMSAKGIKASVDTLTRYRKRMRTPLGSSRVARDRARATRGCRPVRRTR